MSCGAVGRSTDHCEVVAVCDISEDAARRRMAEWKAKKYYTDYRKLMEDPEINAVERLHAAEALAHSANSQEFVSGSIHLWSTFRSPAEDYGDLRNSAAFSFEISRTGILTSFSIGLPPRCS